ncbi:10908_t:CDS:1, partial [Ambispora leptoticha]
MNSVTTLSSASSTSPSASKLTSVSSSSSSASEKSSSLSETSTYTSSSSSLFSSSLSSSSPILSTIIVTISSSSKTISTSTSQSLSTIIPTQLATKKGYDYPSSICLTGCIIQWIVVSVIGAIFLIFLIWRTLACYCYRRKMQNTSLKSNATTKRYSNLSNGNNNHDKNNNDNVNFAGSMTSSVIQRPAASYTRAPMTSMKYSRPPSIIKNSPHQLSIYRRSSAYISSSSRISRNSSIDHSRNSFIGVVSPPPSFSKENCDRPIFININSNENPLSSSHNNNDGKLLKDNKISGIENKGEFLSQSNFVDHYHSRDNSQFGLAENISKDDNSSNLNNMNDLEQQKNHGQETAHAL